MDLVSCVMPTANRRAFIPCAIRMFLGQDYPQKELIIIDDGATSVADLIPSDPRLRYIRSERRRLSLGAKRNLACEAAHGNIILHWDDDDWYAPWRIRYQVEQVSQDVDISGIDHALYVDTIRRQAWEYIELQRGVLCGATLCYRRSFWCSHRFSDTTLEADTRFCWSAGSARVGALQGYRFFVARIHARNTTPKRTHDPRWQPREFDTVRTLISSDWEPCFGGQWGLPNPAPSSSSVSS